MKERKWLYYSIFLGIVIICGVMYILFPIESTEVEVQGQATIGNDELGIIVEVDDTKMIYVDVSGAVVREGVYVVKEGTRLFEVIELAGGLTKEADSSVVNQARIVSDEEHIKIPTKEEVEQGLYQAVNSALVNINTAGISELTALSGIGEAKAKLIIAYRNENGRFQKIEDIMNVDGIKEGLFSKIKDEITVK